MPSPRQRTLLLIATHLAALAIGIVLFRGSPKDTGIAPNSGAPSATANAANEPAAAIAPAATRPTRKTTPAPKNSVHLIAWKALAEEGLTRPERMKASAEILRQWIKDDWQSALDTVMSEPPDDFALLVEFQTVIAKHPEEVWSLIEQRRYGIVSKDLRNQWNSAVRKLDDAALAQLAASLSEPGSAYAKKLIAERNLARNGPEPVK